MNKHQLRRISTSAILVALSIVLIGVQTCGAEPRKDLTLSAPDICIDADYPGGNIIVERIDDDTIYLKQDIRDTKGWWFYWNFRVRGAQGRTLTFQFTDGNPIGTRGPAMSVDSGRTWSWLGRDCVKETSFHHTFSNDAREWRFCFSIPYQQSHLEAWLAQHRDHPNLRIEQHCKTRKGRRVERLHLGRLDNTAPIRIVITARHHACESVASYVLEGLLEAVLADTPEGKWFGNKVELVALPFMDKDGVEDGDQGKNRKPHDHNRDYIGTSIYPSVAALRTFVNDWSAGRLKVVLDLHCPYIRGKHNEDIYMVGSANETMHAQELAFGTVLERVRQGPLPYSNDDMVLFGTAWNVAKNYKGLKSCRQWATEMEQVQLAATFEIPYANIGSHTVTADKARQFGADLARALHGYLGGQ